MKTQNIVWKYGLKNGIGPGLSSISGIFNSSRSRKPSCLKYLAFSSSNDDGGDGDDNVSIDDCFECSSKCPLSGDIDLRGCPAKPSGSTNRRAGLDSGSTNQKAGLDN